MKISFILAADPSPVSNQLDFRYLTRLLNGTGSNGGVALMGCMPLALPTLAALTPPDVEVKIIDENVEDPDLDEPTDVAAISYLTATSDRAYAIAREYRSRGVHVVLGGIHATIFPEEALQHADTVVTGEAEESWPRFVEDFRQGKPRRRYDCASPPDLKQLVIPRWDLLKNRYYSIRHVQTSRGCNQDCDFCAVRAFSGRPRFKPVANVVREIVETKRYSKTPGMHRITFADDNIVSSRRYAAELFRALIPLDIRWSSQCSLSIASDEELLQLAADSGCESLLIGFESLSQQSLNSVNKGAVNRVDAFIEAIERIHAHGIMIYPMMMLGFDEDAPSSFAEMAAFLSRTNAAFPVFNIVTPIPGTRLYERIEREGRVLHRRWSEYNGSHVCFAPKRMTAQQLQDGFCWLQKELYSHQAIFERVEKLWKHGVIRQGRRYLVARTLVTLRLMAELAVQRGPMRRFLARTIRELWARSDISISALLVNLNFFDYAMKLPDPVGGYGATEQLSGTPLQR